MSKKWYETFKLLVLVIGQQSIQTQEPVRERELGDSTNHRSCIWNAAHWGTFKQSLEVSLSQREIEHHLERSRWLELMTEVKSDSMLQKSSKVSTGGRGSF